ncbi:MAG: IS66 family transposase, partial [bacterium]|nr:IS66 family transposase [bacterium]
YHYTTTKKGHHVLDFLTFGEHDDGSPIQWEGTITADAVSSHDCLFVDPARIESGCNAHGLRKFRDEADKAPLLASIAMGFIDAWYTVEEEAKERGLRGAELLAWRQARAGPVAERFEAWLEDHIEELLPSNPVRKAMQYFRNHWKALTHFLIDPEAPLDNNESERALRKVALLRNNSLYASGEDGAVRLCTLWTLIGTCRLIDVEPYGYIEWALTRVVAHPSNRGLAPVDLTPAAYKAAKQEEAGRG